MIEEKIMLMDSAVHLMLIDSLLEMCLEFTAEDFKGLAQLRMLFCMFYP